MTDSPAIRPLRETVLADGFTTLTRHEFELRRRDGSWQYMDREVYARGHGVTCLLYDPESGQVVLTRQFRMAVHVSTGNGLMIESPAGHLDGAEAETRMRAELEEETGYRVQALEHLYDLFFSPGSVAGYQACFLGRFSPGDRIAAGGGLKSEGEDIAVLHLPLNDALAMVERGEIRDGKTVILLQALALRLARGQAPFG